MMLERQGIADLKTERVPICDISPKQLNEIAEFVDENHGTVFHEPFFNWISAQFLGSELSFYLAHKNGCLAGICPCHTYNKGVIRISYSNPTSYDLVYGGWVYDSSMVSLERLLKTMKVRPNEAIHVSSNIELSEDKPYRIEALKTKTANTVLIELKGRSEEELFSGFKHSQKNKIRKAQKLGVSICQICPDDIGRFHSLLAELKGNLGKKYASEEYFRRIFRYYHAQNRAACFMARYGGEDISTLIVLANKAFATIWFGGRKMGIPNNLYQNELMIWEAIKWAKAYGSDYFDLCTVDEENYANLARIKLSFSKDVRPYYHYSIKGLAYKMLNRLQNIFRNI